MSENVTQTKRRQAFDRYSPKEFEELRKQPVPKILEDLRNRGAVELRQTKPTEPTFSEGPKVRIVPRKVWSGTVFGGHFYIHIEGFKDFTTHLRMDVPFPEPEFLKNNPDSWWSNSKHAEFLKIEIESAQIYASPFRQRLCGIGISALRIYLLKLSMDEGGLDSLAIIKELAQHGMLFTWLKQGYIKDFKRIAKMLVPKIIKLVQETPEWLVRLGEEIDRRSELCSQWEPGKPLNWRTNFFEISPEQRTDYMKKFIGRSSTAELIISMTFAICLVILNDQLCLAVRFQQRYPKHAKKIDKKLFAFS